MPTDIPEPVPNTAGHSGHDNDPDLPGPSQLPSPTPEPSSRLRPRPTREREPSESSESEGEDEDTAPKRKRAKPNNTVNFDGLSPEEVEFVRGFRKGLHTRLITVVSTALCLSSVIGC